jgi:hypothetical protein
MGQPSQLRVKFYKGGREGGALVQLTVQLWDIRQTVTA